MMFDNRGLAVCCCVLAGIGGAIAFGLWAFRIIPAWGILVALVGTPVIVTAVVFVLFMLAWMASGSH